jgi:hypothetical protein
MHVSSDGTCRYQKFSSTHALLAEEPYDHCLSAGEHMTKKITDKEKIAAKIKTDKSIGQTGEKINKDNPKQSSQMHKPPIAQDGKNRLNAMHLHTIHNYQHSSTSINL